jgi:hypothetical protein
MIFILLKSLFVAIRKNIKSQLELLLESTATQGNHIITVGTLQKASLFLSVGTGKGITTYRI